MDDEKIVLEAFNLAVVAEGTVPATVIVPDVITWSGRSFAFNRVEYRKNIYRECTSVELVNVTRIES